MTFESVLPACLQQLNRISKAGQEAMGQSESAGEEGGWIAGNTGRLSTRLWYAIFSSVARRTVCSWGSRRSRDEAVRPASYLVMNADKVRCLCPIDSRTVGDGTQG